MFNTPTSGFVAGKRLQAAARCSHKDRTKVHMPTKNVSSFETLNFVVYGPHFCLWLITKKQFLIKFCVFYNQNGILTIGRDNDRTLSSLLLKKLKMSYWDRLFGQKRPLLIIWGTLSGKTKQTEGKRMIEMQDNILQMNNVKQN